MLCIPFNHKCFIFLCLTAPRPSFPTSSRTFSFFPSAPFWLGTVFGFLLNRTPCLILLLSNPSLPAVFSLFSPVLGIFPASKLTALWPSLLPAQEAQRLPDLRPHSWQPGRSLGDVLLTPCSSCLSLRLYCSNLLSGLCASNRQIFKLLPRVFENMVTIISSQRFSSKRVVGASVGSHSHRMKFTPLRWSLDLSIILPAPSLPFPPLHSSSFCTVGWCSLMAPKGFVCMGQRLKAKLWQLHRGLPFFFFCQVRALKNSPNHLLSLSFPLFLKKK